MTIAELFVNLGIKGDGSANKALKGVKSGLGEVKSLSLEAKAAIIGVVYGLERMMSASAQQGTSLENFGAITGLNTQKLQEYQFAARQVGITNEEMAGSFKGVQSSMTNALLGKGLPEGYASVASKTGLNENDMRDTFKVMEKLQEYARITPPDVGTQMLKSFGVSEGVIAGMYRNAFRPEIFARAPKYSDGEIKSLDKVNAAWSNLGTKVQMAFGHFTAANGGKLVGEISELTTKVIHLAEALMKLADSVKLIKGIGRIFEGWSYILDFLNQGVDQNVEAASGKYKSPRTGKTGFMAYEGDAFHNSVQDVKGFIQKIKDVDEVQKVRMQEYLKGDIKPVDWGAKGAQQEINNNVQLYFQHDGRDANKLADAATKGINRVYRQSPAQGQAN